MSKIKTTHFIYDGAKLIGEYNSDGSVKNEYIYLDNIPVGVIPRGYPQDGVKYIHADHLSTPRRLADENGAIVWSWESEPFGESKAVGSVELNLRFAGQYYDDETSTHYNINRDYNPKTGRYLQSDPIGFDGGVNSYGYVGGNPLSAVDEMGLKKLIWFTYTKNAKPKSHEEMDNRNYKIALSYRDDANICIIHSHGSFEGLQRYDKVIYKEDISSLVTILINDGCKKGQSILLSGCNTANYNRDSEPIARALSRTKEFPHVTGATRQVWHYENKYSNRLVSPETYSSNRNGTQNLNDKGKFVTYRNGKLL